MNCFTQPVKTGLTLSTTFVALMLNTSPSLADDCGTSDRVEMPICSRFVSTSNQGNIELFNLCSAKIAVKLAIEGATDKLLYVEPGANYGTYVGTTVRVTSRGSETINRYTIASCCPRYSQCSFPGEAGIAVQGTDPYSLIQTAKADPRYKGN